MVTEDYVSFEIAKLLKEKGFNEEIETIITPDGRIYYVDENSVSRVTHTKIKNSNINIYLEDCSCPTLQMAMKWLREVHNLFIFISTWLRHKDGTIQYYYEIRNLNDEDFETIVDSTTAEFDSYEKICDAATKYCLENLI